MRPGEAIDGYVIRRKIGEGGMSDVYLAMDRREGTTVVLKRLKDEFASDRDFVARFQQEAEIMEKLQHPNVARVLGYIEHNGECLLVEEYLAGGSLADRIAAGEQFSQAEALAWCRDALLGIDCAHRDGILHRDLKPGNLMFDGENHIKITDFGIAKVFGGPRLTKTRSEMGTPAYMSPEQIQMPHKAYHLSDVYSMGVVLYQLLTYKLPFERDTDFDTKQAVVKEPPPPPRTLNPNVSVALQRIVLKAMHKNPSRRYGGCAEFAANIDAYLRGEAPAFVFREWVREHPVFSGIMAFFGVVFLMLVLAAVLRAAPLAGYAGAIVFGGVFELGDAERWGGHVWLPGAKLLRSRYRGAK